MEIIFAIKTKLPECWLGSLEFYSEITWTSWNASLPKVLLKNDKYLSSIGHYVWLSSLVRYFSINNKYVSENFRGVTQNKVKWDIFMIKAARNERCILVMRSLAKWNCSLSSKKLCLFESMTKLPLTWKRFGFHPVSCAEIRTKAKRALTVHGMWNSVFSSFKFTSKTHSHNGYWRTVCQNCKDNMLKKPETVSSAHY